MITSLGVQMQGHLCFWKIKDSSLGSYLGGIQISVMLHYIWIIAIMPHLDHRVKYLSKYLYNQKAILMFVLKCF